jgi:hypothetical protein
MWEGGCVKRHSQLYGALETVVTTHKVGEISFGYRPYFGMTYNLNIQNPTARPLTNILFTKDMWLSTSTGGANLLIRELLCSLHIKSTFKIIPEQCHVKHRIGLPTKHRLQAAVNRVDNKRTENYVQKATENLS